MRIFKKIKDYKTGRRRVYFCGIKILSYRKKTKPPLLHDNLPPAQDIKEFVDYSTPKLKDQDCFVFMNGPSINDAFSNAKFVEHIKKKPVLCVNMFPLAEEFFLIKPSFFTAMDPLFWNPQVNQEQRTMLLKLVAVFKLVTWRLVIFLPKAAEPWNHFFDITNNLNITIVYISTETVPESFSLDDQHLLYEKNRGMPLPQNVVIGALFVALNLDYKNIYLLGAHFDGIKECVVKKDNIVYTTVRLSILKFNFLLYKISKLNTTASCTN